MKSAPRPLSDPLTPAEVAATLGIHPVGVRQACREGRLPAHRSGREWLITADDAEAYQREREKRLGLTCSCGVRSEINGITRHCRGCHANHDLEAFYVDPRSRDGRRTQCKACLKIDLQAYKSRNHVRLSEARRQWRAEHPDESRRQSRAWVDKYPSLERIAHRAREAVARAIRTGRLTRPSTCSQCAGPGPIEAAHQDYARRLDVVWLCRSCHRRWDKLVPKLREPESA